jgi:hypothetical protein
LARATQLDGAEELQRRLAAISDTRQLLGVIALRAVAEAKALVPRRTGNLGRTIRLGRVDKDSAEVLAGGKLKVGYAAAVEFGTKAHVIRPRRRKALAWGGSRTLAGGLRKGSRATNFATKVNHPGTRAQPYLIPGIRKALRDAGIKAHIRDAWNRAA